MSLEIKTATLEPVRQTFANIARRFGEKPASRYQEATYDAQATTNFHYRPLWMPEKQLNDPSHTALTMQDWYALKDPRQFYYGAYVQNRAKMQEAAENNYAFFEKRGLAQLIDADIQARIIFALLPLRHVEQTANLNMMSGSAYGYGTALTQACLYAAMDRLGMAQYLSRIGLLLDGNSGQSLAQAKQAWMEHPAWQGVRALCEEMLVQKDWGELFVAQNLVADSLVNQVFYQQFDQWLASNGARDIAMLTEFMQLCLKDHAAWADNVLKTLAADNEANRTQLAQWLATWQDKVLTAYQPLLAELFSDSAQAVTQAVQTDIHKRASKIGLPTTGA